MLKSIDKKLLEKAMKSDTKEKALEILKQGGVELTEEDLQGVSGGEGCDGICMIHGINDGDECLYVWGADVCGWFVRK